MLHFEGSGKVVIGQQHLIGPKKLCVDGTYGINSTHSIVSEIDIFSKSFLPFERYENGSRGQSCGSR